MDLADLRSVYAAEGPFVTVYLDTDSAVEDAAQRLEVRWKDAERTLRDLGVDDATVSALAAARGSHPEGGTRVLVAAQGRVQLATSLESTQPQDDVRVGPLPHLFPLVSHVVGRMSYVLVKCDRTGADLVAVRPDLPDEVWQVEGPKQHHLRKVKGQGLAHLRIQHRAENFWDKNVRAVVDDLVKVSQEVSSDLVVLTGDETAVAILEREAPEALKPQLVAVPGGRNADGSEELVEQRVEVEVARQTAQQQESLLAKFTQERGQDDKASDGVAETVAALQKAQVDVLLLSHDVPDRTAFFGPEPTAIGLSPEDVRALGVEHPTAAPLVDVLLRAAVGTSATVAVVASGDQAAPTDGVGGLLRFATVT